MTSSARTPIVLPSALSPLIEQQRWVVWRWIADKAGKRTKPPFQARAPHKYASSTDPATWCDFDTAMRAYCAHKADGIGYALSGGEIGAFDIDHCIDAATGGVHPWAKALVCRCGSYAEVTPSKTGIRIIGLVSGSELHRKFPVPKANGMSIEVYRRAERYITISGNQFGDSVELVNIDREIDTVASKLDSGKQQNEPSGESKSKQHDLDSLIRNGCGDDFGGDRSRGLVRDQSAAEAGQVSG
jgi:primase-polymerase (primpol)-like protein